MAARSVGRGEALRELAALAGIVPEYIDQTGKERRLTTDAARLRLLTAMGFDVATVRGIRASLSRLREERAAEVIAPVAVVQTGAVNGGWLAVRFPDGTRRWHLELTLESGERITREGLPSRGGGGRGIALPRDIEPGYHSLRLVLDAAHGTVEHTQSRIVTPRRCVLPRELMGRAKGFGVVANLYSINSERNWGAGDFTDLGALAEWTARQGGAFVGVNPLHVLLNRGADISPYSPVSRLWRNALYMDVEAVPELRMDERLARRLDHPELGAELTALREGERVQYERVMQLKWPVIEELHRVFATRVRGGRSARARAYDAWVREREPGLTRYATWMVIAEEQERSGNPAPYAWHTWPAELRDAQSEAVRWLASRNAERVDLHRWVQFELDRQLGEAAERGREAGLDIGLYQDLAIGSSPNGSDTWSFPELFARGVNVGAPPDPYSATGQDWGLPPLEPNALRRDRYRYFIELVRNAFRHAGALRIDHAIGLFRLFWIPQGKTGRDGAYVRYAAEDFLGILALESMRHSAVVVGEDLGTVPPEVPPAFARWGVLSSKVMIFERGVRGAFKPSKDYPVLALATADTHDMATMAGFWRGRDLEIRKQVGLTRGAAAARKEQQDRVVDRRQLVRRLIGEGVLDARSLYVRDTTRGSIADTAALRRAVHDFMARTRSTLVGIALDDIAGEAEPVNVPGVGPDKFPSWTRRMRTRLDEIIVAPEMREALGEQRGRTR